MKCILKLVIPFLIFSCSLKTSTSISDSEISIIADFLDDDNWRLVQICVEGECENIEYDDMEILGVETLEPAPNLCTGEPGDFFILGKYVLWTPDYGIGPKEVTTFSEPDYFRVLKKNNKNVNTFKIQLCTFEADGYYPGVLKIVDDLNFQIIANRPEYENKEVVKKFRRLNKSPLKWSKP